MIDLTKYNFDSKSSELVSDIIKGLNNQNEIDLCCKNYFFSIEPANGKFVIFDAEGKKGEYDELGDLFENFKIDGLPLVELVSELDFA